MDHQIARAKSKTGSHNLSPINERKKINYHIQEMNNVISQWQVNTKVSSPYHLLEIIIRTVESLNGHDDVGVYDLIKSVKQQKLRCSQPSLLLDYVLIEKIYGSAIRSIRYTHINNCEDLYKSVGTNLGTTTSIELCHAKLETVRQENDTIQVYNQRFRSVINELMYALQSEYSKGIERKLALQMEEKNAVKRFVICSFVQTRQQPPTSDRFNRLPVRPPSQTNIQSRGQTPAIRNQTTSLPNHGMPLQQRMQLRCRKCNNIGHLEAQCYATLKQSFQQGYNPKQPPQIHNIQETEKEVSLEYKEVPEEEQAEIERYDNTVEYQPSAEDYNLCAENQKTDASTDYWSTQDHQLI